MGTGRRCPRAGPQWASRLLAAPSGWRPGWQLPARTCWGGARGGRGRGGRGPPSCRACAEIGTRLPPDPRAVRDCETRVPSRCAGLPARLEDSVSGPGSGVPASRLHVQALGWCGRSAGWADWSVPPGLSVLARGNQVGGDGVGGWSGRCETGRENSVGRGKAPPLSRNPKQSVGLKRAARSSSASVCGLLAPLHLGDAAVLPQSMGQLPAHPRRTFFSLLLLDLQAPRDRISPELMRAARFQVFRTVG